MDYHAYKEKQYQILANAVRENMDMKKIYEIIEKGKCSRMFHLITGGSGSGKSEYAEQKLMEYASHSKKKRKNATI